MHVFYHVSYSKPYNKFKDLEINQEYIFGNDLNTFYSFFYDTDDHVSITVNGENELVHYSTNLEALSEGKCSSYPPPKILLPHLNEKFNNLFNLNRELLLENIRLQSYPEMPSRQKCLWVTKSKEEAMVWVDYFKNDGGLNLKLLTLEASNDAIKLDSKFIPLKHDSLKTQEEKAHKYWSGQQSDDPMMEYLFHGKAKIKQIEGM